MAEQKLRFKVVGTQAVGGVEPGGVVELDPATTNIEALVFAGHVAPLSKAAKAAAQDEG